MQYEVTAGIYTIWDKADGAPDGSVITEVVAPTHLSVESIIELLPPQRTIGVAVRRDAASGFLTVSGPNSAVNRVLDAIASIDRPAPTISYQLLIVEYHEESALDVDSSISSRLTGPESVQAFVGAIGPLLTLNFDVLSAFGYEFALDLAARLESSKAAVVLDTELQGVAGESVRFESREVQRVWSASADGAGHTPVLQEIGAGLETRITGRIGEENEVIVQVEMVVSRFDGGQRDKASGPNTRERVVATTARGRAGIPIVLSAYMEDGSVRRHIGPPLLSRIPIVRRLFGVREEESATTELGIYLIPRIVGASNGPSLEDELADLFARHVETNDEIE
jgi:type II secretory pathway component GspD/PulD (secretin)